MARYSAGLQARLKDDYGQAKATIKAELQAIDRRQLHERQEQRQQAGIGSID